MEDTYKNLDDTGESTDKKIINCPSQTYGNIEFQEFSFKKFSKSNSLLHESIDEREFAQKLLYALIISPQIEFPQFTNISDIELIKIIRCYCENCETLRPLFGTIGDEHVFREFRGAIKKYNHEEVRSMISQSDPIRIPFFRDLPKFLPRQIPYIQSLIEQQQKIYNQLIEPIERLQKTLEKFKITVESANKILKKYKWFVSLGLPDQFYGEVIRIDSQESNKKKKMNDLFIGYFSQNSYKELENLIEEWNENPLFKPRMKIFRNSVKTLKNAKKRDNPSLIVIPVLIAQIDGIMNQIIAKYNISHDKKTKQWVDNSGNVSKTEKEAKAKVIKSLNEFTPVGEYILLDILFQTAFPNQELSLSTTFSRHKIMHGEKINYGRIENTIKAVLILDFLHYLEMK